MHFLGAQGGLRRILESERTFRNVCSGTKRIMSDRDLAILKFGGSILQDHECLDVVVEECHRAVHAGSDVIAVVSAYRGMTDLLQTEVDSHQPDLEPGAVTAMLSIGEVLASSQAGFALLAAGLDAHVATVREIGLLAVGDPMDARPIGLDVPTTRELLDRLHVLVVPGYMAVDRAGRLALMGRGGSDMTALHLACMLKADSCTLVKDIDGLHESDPNRGVRWPRRYASIDFEDAKRLGPRIVQPKALELAGKHDFPFLVRSSPSTGGTLVGGATRIEEMNSIGLSDTA